MPRLVRSDSFGSRVGPRVVQTQGRTSQQQIQSVPFAPAGYMRTLSSNSTSGDGMGIGRVDLDRRGVKVMLFAQMTRTNNNNHSNSSSSKNRRRASVEGSGTPRGKRSTPQGPSPSNQNIQPQYIIYVAFKPRLHRQLQ
ncbi:hypothetical protein BDN72DRAFT_214028 [Pluteus cervinus]|uniref:Uncharacterized protein n=1 Tax=Pluteus cervinus TaxID=181527 RepID=A0ACD3B6H9_9AGAR|nr:hypothetical protein BDN72DRAFT_214028 [Pluteus cervinus]